MAEIQKQLNESINKEKISADTISNEKTQSTVQNRLREELKISNIPALKVGNPIISELEQNKKIQEYKEPLSTPKNNDFKIFDQNKSEDIFDKEIVFKEKKKGKNSQIKINNKKESFSNMEIFKKILESEKNGRRDSHFRPSISFNDSYIQHTMKKVNNQGGVNNSTFIFDEKKENDIVLCISNLNNNDFLENSIDSNFKREILSTNTKFLGAEKNTESKNELEITKQTNRLNNSTNNENVKLVLKKEEKLLKTSKCSIIIMFVLILIIVIILFYVFIRRLIK